MKYVAFFGSLLSFAALAQQPNTIPETYVVQPGDTCMDIAKKFFGSASEYPRLHEYNDMGPLPHNLKPGSIIQLKEAALQKTTHATLKSDALLTASRATVHTRSAQIREWKLAERNQPLFRLDEVHTLSNASADILFRDHSSLQMKQNALIIIYGGSSSKVRFQKAGGVQLLHGELGISLTDLRKPPANILTPSVEVSVRATHAIVDVDSEQTSRVSIQKGEANITAQGKSVRLKSGQGIRVRKNTPPGAPQQLPPPPAWKNSQTHELHLSHAAQNLAPKLQWTPSPSPGLYRVEVAQDNQFQKPIFEKITEQLEFLLSELPNGTFYVRARTIDELGLISSPSPPKRLDILKIDIPPDSETPAQPSPNAAQTPVQVLLNKALSLPEDIQAFVDGKPSPLPLLFQQPGIYLVEFKTMSGQLSSPIKMEAIPPKSTLSFRLNEGTLELWLHFETAIPENTQLRAQGLGQTQVGPLLRLDEQTFKATVSGQYPNVNVFWGDYLLGNLQEDSPATTTSSP
ncbi:MAG: FecR domain-containing protein, partial [Cystobacterineae bacterium]|nr:FecR domain-containing protein [Cystobacterineae bacterium]